MNPTYFIAEAGLNHNGQIDIAKKMIDDAYNAGADAIKFQTYKSENFLSESFFNNQQDYKIYLDRLKNLQFYFLYPCLVQYLFQINLLEDLR